MAQYIVKAEPVMQLTTDPVFDACLRIERGELDAYAAAQRIRAQIVSECLAYLAGFIGDDFDTALEEFKGERDARAQMDLPEW